MVEWENVNFLTQFRTFLNFQANLDAYFLYFEIDEN